jgi:hypothetical protein
VPADAAGQMRTRTRMRPSEISQPRRALSTSW